MPNDDVFVGLIHKWKGLVFSGIFENLPSRQFLNIKVIVTDIHKHHRNSTHLITPAIRTSRRTLKFKPTKTLSFLVQRQTHNCHDKLEEKQDECRWC